MSQTDRSAPRSPERPARAWFETAARSVVRRIRGDRGRAAVGRPRLAGSRAPRGTRPGGGGGVMSVMRGRVFEKVGVNVSTVWGEFSPEFRAQIQGAEQDPRFWASGISLVAHMQSPRVPAAHFNTRMLITTKGWFGGGGDLTPMRLDTPEAIEPMRPTSTPPSRRPATGTTRRTIPSSRHGATAISSCRIAMSRAVPAGSSTTTISAATRRPTSPSRATSARLSWTPSPASCAGGWHEAWTAADREHQLIRRGRYVEFNLIHDRGTLFGLKTGGNVEAILMSLPPEVKWP